MISWDVISTIPFMAVEEHSAEDKEIGVAMATDYKHCQNGVLAVGKLMIANGTPGGTNNKDLNGVEDDELTSLSWLQDTNLLKNFRMGPYNMEGEDVLSDSPSSDYLDEPVEHVTLNGEQMDQNVDQISLSGHMPYNPTLHANSKPPYSFSCLIFMAIEDSPNKALPVKDIYSWILNHFPYFQNAPTGWKNSVRHNLSLSKCFRKVEKEKGQNVGKGSLWCIDPEFRPNLIQALQKAPSMANVEFSHFTQISSSYCHNGKSEGDIKPCLLVSSQQAIKIPSPDLFPYLSRRLASSMKDPEVDAAATMLTLKNGPSITGPQNCSEESESDSLSGIQRRFPRKRIRIRPHDAAPTAKRKKSAATTPIITSSPSEDHTYSACLTPQGCSPSLSPLSSELRDLYEDSRSASEDDSAELDSSTATDMTLLRSKSTKEEDEERKKIAEGAHALLNLAKIATKRRQLKGFEKKSS